MYTTGLNFNVYGSWGRPDIAPFLFKDVKDKVRFIDVFKDGEIRRNFNYIEYIVVGVMCIQYVSHQVSDSTDSIGGALLYKIFDIGNNQPVVLELFITCIKNLLQKKITKNYLQIQAVDVVRIKLLSLFKNKLQITKFKL
jgi:UDP-glucuronate 4-epimerase